MLSATRHDAWLSPAALMKTHPLAQTTGQTATSSRVTASPSDDQDNPAFLGPPTE